MARHKKGWVKLWRASLDSFQGNGTDYLVFILLLQWANTRDNGVCKRGQLITSISEIARQAGLSRGSVYRCLLTNSKTNRIRTKTEHPGTRITIINYKHYQASEEGSETDHKQIPNSNRKHNEEGRIKKEEGRSIVCSQRDALPNQPTPFTDPVVLEFLQLAKIKTSTQNLWVKTYEDLDWLNREILKAIDWLDNNPQRRPKKNYAAFLGKWFSRGWEWHRKTISSNAVQEKTDIEALLKKEDTKHDKRTL